jgi:hypothetical protein
MFLDSGWLGHSTQCCHHHPDHYHVAQSHHHRLIYCLQCHHIHRAGGNGGLVHYRNILHLPKTACRRTALVIAVQSRKSWCGHQRHCAVLSSLGICLPFLPIEQEPDARSDELERSRHGLHNGSGCCLLCHQCTKDL